jgi:protein-disulfide isomerase
MKDLNSRRVDARIREDVLSGFKSGVNGTPTFFINGLRYSGPWDLESLLPALRQQIEAKKRRAA